MTSVQGAALASPIEAQASRQILLVDDDVGANQALGHLLEGCGILRCATSGAEALRLARARLPDLVLLDAEMPGMSGFEVCRAMGNDALLAQVPVIFVTSHREPAFEAEALGMGAADFISKPPISEQVLARVRAQFRQPPTRPPATHAGPHPTCLVVFDTQPSALQFERIALAPMVGTLQFAATGPQALAEMAQTPPDLVLVAVDMPGLDGFAVLRQLQASATLCHVPVLVVCGRADWRAEAHAFELGASDFIARPYTPAVLQARVRNLLRRVHKNDQARQARRSAWQRLGDAKVADLVAAASDPLLSVDAQGAVVLINSVACCLIGVDAAQALGRPLADVWAGARWRQDPVKTWHLGEGAARITMMRLGSP